VTFDRRSGKFPLMKARIYIYAIVFAAGMLTALADEPKTNTQTGATTSIPANTNEVAVPPTITATSTPAPAVVRKVKPSAVVPLTTTNAITPPPMTTSTSAPALTGEVKPPEDESLMETSAVPVQSNIPAAPPPESSEISWKGALAIGVAILAVAGGLVIFMLRRLGKTDHASLITRAMGEHKDEDKHEDKPEEKREPKKETQKFPPPMT